MKSFFKQCQANLKDGWVPGYPDVLPPTLSVPSPAKVGEPMEQDWRAGTDAAPVLLSNTDNTHEGTSSGDSPSSTASAAYHAGTPRRDVPALCFSVK